MQSALYSRKILRDAGLLSALGALLLLAGAPALAWGEGALSLFLLYPLLFLTMRHAPRLAHPLILLSLGLVQDIVYSLLLGSSSLALFILRAVLLRQQRRLRSQPFGVIWGAASLAILCSYGLIWAIHALVQPGTPGIASLWPGMVICSICYPLLHTAARTVLREDA